MKKWITWFLMLTICIIALNALYNYIMFTPLENDLDLIALLLYIPIFGVICLGNIIVHLYALITVLTKTNNSVFLTLNSFIENGV